MANEILLASQLTPTDVVSTLISRALIDRVVTIPLISSENLPVGTNVRKARKDDALGTGAVVTEASNYSYGGNADYAQTAITLTMAKTVIASKITVEAAQFGGVSDQNLIDRQANSLARTLDNNIKALIDGFSTVVTSVGTCTPDDVLQCVYNIESSYAGRQNGNLVGCFDFKQSFELKKYALNATAPAFTNQSNISLLSGITKGNGWFGSLPGVDLYVAGGLDTAAGLRKCGVWNPELAIYGNYGTVQVERKNPDSQGLFTEITSYIFSQVAEWNDLAGVELDSPQ